jgi:hypothetical protein
LHAGDLVRLEGLGDVHPSSAVCSTWNWRSSWRCAEITQTGVSSFCVVGS